ncbi:polysaccharide biosynthesis/export family protein [Burkholderia pseudomallei]|uniref:polysaccharide biosynthesis/export family protein n=1 Tax=Burkholderia pseudomallei TaxID=28450 RepID=UPI001A9E4B65|nr:polysaccharide biosynthesis/export family protein [Burkholderia pseudomallei]MBO2986529.1 polysaccharide biosynthesis/export family protein [Burkholderia pseudomallei]MBO7791016.1 polysaccharide biosynthesis/export family protein [Burkholderia pseudomallei]MBO7863322.1 polysaccharide biosynthesis/export family protein [Burkholderia pseudomallei]MBO7876176.1 polysaccharide biosynthesis/export family protein [Burkholderia pseudomallei]MBO7918837.1 polysaccharide biosynthesis/export family pro
MKPFVRRLRPEPAGTGKSIEVWMGSLGEAGGIAPPKRTCGARVRRLMKRVTLCAALAALSACGVAPGMRMKQPANVPVSSAAADAPAEAGRKPRGEQLPVPITDIDLSLIRTLRDAQQAPRRAADLVSPASGYTIGCGDVLQITVWDHPEFAAALGTQQQTAARAADAPAGFVVDQDGTLQYPYVGRIAVAGLKPEQVQARLARQLAQTFRDPQVTVRIASFRAKQVYIEGEVHTPGSQALNDIPMTLYDAVSRAGGFSASADQRRVTLVRDGVERRIDLSGAAQGINPSRIVLRDGDLLRIPPRDESGVFVMGEVNRPVTALPMRNGRLTLSEALSQAGSLNATTADAAQLYVIRGSLDAKPHVYRLDASSPVAMVLANQFELEPKDIVYVDGNGLVRFSRVLSLLLPAVNAGLTAAVATK